MINIQYTIQPKKMLIINIIDILKKYSDEDHRLNQKQICDLLNSEYNMKVDRKAVKRNIMNLIDYGFNIEYSENIRMTPSPKTGKTEQTYILSDFYLQRDFTDAELRLLIDGLLFSKHLPYSQCKELIEKIEGLSNQYFCSRVKHVRNLPENQPVNKELFYIISILDEAISKNKQVSFYYNYYDTDKKLHPRFDETKNPKKYIINPYQMVATNGRYYLICNLDEYDNLGNYRIDRISNIELLGTAAKPTQKIKETKNGFNLSKHMAENIYMYHGECGTAKFRAKRFLINDILDWFGSDTEFSDITEDEITATVSVNYEAMRIWALQYVRYIKLLSPQWLVKEISNDLIQAVEKYNT